VYVLQSVAKHAIADQISVFSRSFGMEISQKVQSSIGLKIPILEASTEGMATSSSSINKVIRGGRTSTSSPTTTGMQPIMMLCCKRTPHPAPVTARQNREAHISENHITGLLSILVPIHKLVSCQAMIVGCQRITKRRFTSSSWVSSELAHDESKQCTYGALKPNYLAQNATEKAKAPLWL